MTDMQPSSTPPDRVPPAGGTPSLDAGAAALAAQVTPQAAPRADAAGRTQPPPSPSP